MIKGYDRCCMSVMFQSSWEERVILEGLQGVYVKGSAYLLSLAFRLFYYALQTDIWVYNEIWNFKALYCNLAQLTLGCFPISVV